MILGVILGSAEIRRILTRFVHLSPTNLTVSKFPARTASRGYFGAISRGAGDGGECRSLRHVLVQSAVIIISKTLVTTNWRGQHS